MLRLISTALFIAALLSPAPALANWDERPFTAQLADGTELSPDDLKGKIVLVSFWATWCSHCLPTLSKIEALYNTNSDNQNIAILSVHSGKKYSGFDSAAEFLKQKRGIELPVIQDEDGSLMKTFSKAVSVPQYILIDENGVIIENYRRLDDFSLAKIQHRFDYFTRQNVNPAKVR